MCLDSLLTKFGGQWWMPAAPASNFVFRLLSKVPSRWRFSKIRRSQFVRHPKLTLDAKYHLIHSKITTTWSGQTIPSQKFDLSPYDKHIQIFKGSPALVRSVGASRPPHSLRAADPNKML